MDALQFAIARFLAGKALQKRRTTYQQVGEAVGWNHPTGRGLGRNLEVILHELADRGLPPLTTILVKKGERHPAEDAMTYIRSVLGAIDIESAQQEVFAFDWTSVPDLAPTAETLPVGPQVWLTSFWGFDPASWGCIGFADEARRTRYLRNSKPGTLVAIYVTKGKGPENMRGKVVGVVEIFPRDWPRSVFHLGGSVGREGARPRLSWEVALCREGDESVEDHSRGLASGGRIVSASLWQLPPRIHRRERSGTLNR